MFLHLDTMFVFFVICKHMNNYIFISYLTYFNGFYSQMLAKLVTREESEPNILILSARRI